MGYQKCYRPLFGPGFIENNRFTGAIGIQSSELDQSLLQKLVVTLTATQIEAMHGAPVSVVPAPGAGLVALADSFHVQFKPGTTQFTGGGAINFVYHGTAIIPHSSTIPAAKFTAATASDNLLPPLTGVTQAPTNTGIDITNATAAFATGNGTAIVTIWYMVLTLS